MTSLETRTRYFAEKDISSKRQAYYQAKLAYKETSQAERNTRLAELRKAQGELRQERMQFRHNFGKNPNNFKASYGK